MRSDLIDSVVAAPISISEKIRRLDREGLARAEIARRLGKRYQHVRNVLEAEKAKSGQRESAASTEAPAARSAGSIVQRVQVETDGSLRLSAGTLAGLELASGEAVVLVRTGKELSLMSAGTARKKAQAMFREMAGDGDAVADFLNWKREQAEEEDRTWRS